MLCLLGKHITSITAKNAPFSVQQLKKTHKTRKPSLEVVSTILSTFYFCNNDLLTLTLTLTFNLVSSPIYCTYGQNILVKEVM